MLSLYADDDNNNNKNYDIEVRRVDPLRRSNDHCCEYALMSATAVMARQQKDTQFFMFL